MIAFPLGLVSEAGPARSASGQARIWRGISLAAVLVAVAVSVAIGWGADRPTFPYDEIDQLQMGRMLAGMDIPKVTGAGYYPLWSLLLVPLWWLTGGDGLAVYGGAIALSITVGLVAIIPLARLAMRFRLSAAQAVTAAAITVTMPAVSLQSDYALSERLLFFMMALSVLTAWRLWESPTATRAVVFGLTLGALYFTHVRVLAVVLAAGVWILLFGLRNWRVAVVGALALTVSALAAHYGGRGLNEMLLGEFSQGESLFEGLSATRPGLLLRSALGQAWTQIAGSFGLAAVGLVALSVWSWQEIRRLRAGRATFVLGVVVALFLLTTLKWASDFHLYTNSWRRIDTWLYGRYLDPVAVILVLIALAVIIRAARRSIVLWSGLLSILVILPAVVWVGREAPLWAYRTPAHLPGIMPWWGLLPTAPVAPGEIPSLLNEGRFWIVASLMTLAALAGVLVFRRVPVLLVVALTAVFATAALVADGSSNEFRAGEGAPPQGIPVLRESLRDADGTVEFDWGCHPDGSRSSVALNYLAYWLLPTVVETVDTARGDVVDADVLISCDPDDGGTLVGTEGMILLENAQFRDRTIWVRPGPVADRIAALAGKP